MLELARVDQPLENIKLLSYIFMLSPRTFLVRLLLIILKLIQVLDIANVEVQVTASVYFKLSLNLSLRYFTNVNAWMDSHFRGCHQELVSDSFPPTEKSLCPGYFYPRMQENASVSFIIANYNL